MRIALTLLLLVLATAVAQAAAPKPAREMKKAIDAFEGSWTIEEEYPESAGAAGKGRGTEIWTAGPGNMSLIYDYASDTPRGRVTAHAVLWWDARAKTFRELWCTSSAPACTLSPAIIRWDGDDLVFTETFERNGKRVASREVWSGIAKDAHTMTISQGPTASTLKPWLISHATRTK
ncbi:MAG: hypothetical protein GC190_02630 [Alphaproteobacteria bacterium]|nr:hypothetical protein [Alphaproteobacteria bacterium]